MESLAATSRGKRLVPSVIDEIALREPNKPWGSMPVDSADLSKGWTDISYAAFANAINRVAWWIEDHVGRSSNFEPVAYFGPGDHRTLIFFWAIIKTGHLVGQILQIQHGTNSGA